MCDDVSCSISVPPLPPLPPNKKGSIDTGADINSKKDSGVDIRSDSSVSIRSESSGSVMSSPLTSVLSSPLNSVLFSPISDLGGSWRKYTSNKFWANQDSVREGAWGLVVVTASMAGDIRVYQNFGLPVRINRSIQIV